MGAFTYSLLAALLWGVSPLFEKYAIARVDPMAGLLIRGAGVALGTLFLFAVLPDRTRLLGSLSPTFVLCFLTAGILASVIGQIFAYNAIKLADVSRVTPIMGAWPLLTVFLGWLLMREPLSLPKILGACCIIFGVWLLRF